MVGKRFDVEANGLLAGKRVEVPADGVHLARNILCGAGPRSLKKHVLHEMRDAVDLGRFAARARLDPHTHGDGAEMFHAFGKNNQAAGQYGTAKVSLVDHRLSSNIEVRLVGSGRTPVQRPHGIAHKQLLYRRDRDGLQWDVEMLYAG